MESINKSNVTISFFTRLKLKDWRIGQKLLSIIYLFGEDFAPQQVDYGKGWHRISASDYAILEEVWPSSLSERKGF